MLKKLAMVFGVVFVAVGVLGFVPGITTDDNLLLGIFLVGVVQNMIHILGGVAAFLSAKSEDYAQLYFRIFGVVYAIVAVVGIAQSDTVLGLFAVNAAENVLHVVLAVVLLGIGFGVPKSHAPAKTV